MTEQKAVVQGEITRDLNPNARVSSVPRRYSENGESSAIRSSRTKRPTGMGEREVEWQFDAEDLKMVEGWIEAHPSVSGLYVAPGSAKELADTYYDTEDWRLYRAGYALRIRDGGGKGSRGHEATMKSLVPVLDDNGSVRRCEISEPLRSGEVGALLHKKRLGPVGERLRALIGARQLRPLFEVRTRRQTYDLFDGPDAGDSAKSRGGEDALGEIVEDASGNIRRKGAGFRVGEISLDESEVLPGNELVRLTRVEVEADSSMAEAPADFVAEAFSELEALVGAMEKDLGLRPASTSKYEAGLIAGKLDPEEVLDLGPTFVDDSLSVGEVAFRVLRRQFAEMRKHEPGTRLGEDAEELHDMRVATRRMRAALKLFEDALPERAPYYREELKFFAGVLGDVRDLDVQIEQLEQEAGGKGLEPLLKAVDALEKRRAAARTRLLEALDSERYERFESSFAALLRRGVEADPEQEGAIGSPAADEPILAAAPAIVSRAYRKWRKAAKRVEKDGSGAEEYHELRKKGKRLRYALEFLSDVYGEKATGKLVKRLKTLQDDLGRHQDLIVAAGLLKELATDGRGIPSQTAFAMGVLAERGLREAADLRASVPNSKAYRKLRKGKTRKKLEEYMEKRRSKAKVGGKKKG